MRFITAEHQKVLDRLSSKERAEVIKVLESVSGDIHAAMFSSWCRIVSYKLVNSLKYHWKDWLKIIYTVTVITAFIFLSHEKRVFMGYGRHWNMWLASYYLDNLVGTGFIGMIIHIAFAAIGYTLYFYGTAWVFTCILKIMHLITSNAEDKWAKRRNALFGYLNKRDDEAEINDPSIWYAPREKEAMKFFAESNPNYHTAKGRAWANKL